MWLVASGLSHQARAKEDILTNGSAEPLPPAGSPLVARVHLHTGSISEVPDAPTDSSLTQQAGGPEGENAKREEPSQAPATADPFSALQVSAQPAPYSGISRTP